LTNAIHNGGFATVYLKIHRIKVTGENYVNCETDLFSAAVTRNEQIDTSKIERTKKKTNTPYNETVSQQKRSAGDHLYDRKALKCI